MKFVIVIFLSQLFILQIYCIGWEKMGNGVNLSSQTIYIDSSDNKIYLGGQFYKADSINALEIAVWNGVHWDSVGRGQTFGLNSFAITKYQNQIYSDGRFTSNNPYNYGARFNGIAWDSLGLGVNGPIYQFKEVNGSLWVAGFFTEANGTSCNMLATWDGNNWSCPDLPYHNNIKDFNFYNGELILGGNFFDSLNNNIDLAAFDGTNYHIIGHPIYGNWTSVNAIAIYLGDLYIGGFFSTTDGNEGNNIMRWDGNQWYSLNGGTDSEIDCFYVYNNELYVGGMFQYAGGIQTGNLAKWDGSQWFPVTSSIISPGIHDIQFYNNEMYIAGGFRYIDSLEVNYIAKYSGPLSVNEKVDNFNVKISPNPVIDFIRVYGLKSPVDKIRISDLAGKCVYVDNNFDESKTIGISFLKSGFYFLIIETKEGLIVKKFIKNSQ